MNLTELTAISPIDGRYRNKVSELAEYFSEFGLFRYRVLVEIEYFIALSKIPLPQLKEYQASKDSDLRKIYEQFSFEDALRIKDIEKTTNHDIKAVEYFIKQEFDKLGLSKFKEFIHFGLTSQDINNTSIPLSMKDGVLKSYLPVIEELIKSLKDLASQYADIPMLAHTHGQPASPTKLGKEFEVFVERLEKQVAQLKQVPFSAKFGGATGNFNAHLVAYPNIDWVTFANNFVDGTLGLSRSKKTTQIEHYDNIASGMDAVKRINNIIIDLDRDIWSYISMNYFKQRIVKGEVGSSTMPHKVNPIDFENSEGNLGVANALAEHIASKLPVSRLQRDLTDSTVLRNLGVVYAHCILAYKSTLKGLSKLLVNKDKILQDLDDNCIVVAEAIQTILRREGYPKPYEILRDLTRVKEKLTIEDIYKFVDTLNIDESIKSEIKNITPQNYTGI